VKLLLRIRGRHRRSSWEARYGGVGLGCWAAPASSSSPTLRLPPTAPPIDVMLIHPRGDHGTSVMEAAGGIDWLVRVAEGLMPAEPEADHDRGAGGSSWLFTLGRHGARLLPSPPVIHEVAHENGHPAPSAPSPSPPSPPSRRSPPPPSRGHGGDDRPVRARRDQLGTIIAIAIPATLIG